MIDSNYYIGPDPEATYVRLYTKTKPTTDFYIRVTGWHVYEVS